MSSPAHDIPSDLQIDKSTHDLIIKINAGDSSLLNELLNVHRFDVNGYFFSKLDKKVTLLYRAAQKNNVDVARKLLEHRDIEVNKATGSDKTPLYAAAREGHLEIAKLMLGSPKIDVNKKNKENTVCPFYLAVQNGHLEVTKLFLENPDTDVNNARSTGSTPIYITTKFGHLEIVKLLLQRPGILVNQPLTKNLGGETPLYIACKQGFSQIVKVLLQYPDTDINQRLFKNTKPLQQSEHTENDDNENVELIEHSEQCENVRDEFSDDTLLNTYERFLEVKGQGQTALARICGYSQHIDKAQGWKFFAEGKGSINLQDNNDGDEDNLLQLLQMHEVEIVLRSVRTERRVIVRPAISSLCEIIKILLSDEKIDVGVKDDEGKTALFHACKYGHAKFVTLLLDAGGAEVNQVCKSRDWLNTQFFTEQGTILIDALYSNIERLEKLKVLFSRLDLQPNQISQYYLKFGDKEICASGNIVIGAILLGFEDDNSSYLKTVMEAASKSTHTFDIEITWLQKSELGNIDQLDISTQKNTSILEFLICHSKISLVSELFEAFLAGQVKINQSFYFVDAFPSMSEEEGFQPILNNFVEHEHLVVQRVGEQSSFSKKQQQKLWGLLGSVPYIEKLVEKASEFNIFRSIFVNTAVEFQWTTETKFYYRSQFAIFLIYLFLFLSAVLIHLDWSLKISTETYVRVRPILWCTLPFVVLMVFSEILQLNYSLPNLKNFNIVTFFGGLMYDLVQIQTVSNLLDWFIIIVGIILPFVWSRDDENLMSVVAVHIVVLFFRLTIWMHANKQLGHYVLMMILITWRTFMFIVVITIMLLFFTIAFMVLFQKTEHSNDFFKSLFTLSQALFDDIDFDHFYDLNSPAREIGLFLRLVFILIIQIISINLLIALMTSIYEEVSKQREATYIRNRALIALEANQFFENIGRVLKRFKKEEKELSFVRFEELRKELGFVVGGSKKKFEDYLMENFSRIEKQYLEVQKQLVEISKEQADIAQKIK